MARQQHENAIKMGDLLLAAECRIHMVYLAIQCGELQEAKVLIASQRKRAVEELSSDEGILSMLQAAEIYTDKLKIAIEHRGKSTSIHSDPNFQRQVRTNAKLGRIHFPYTKIHLACLICELYNYY